jgi:hypothetical protein
MNENVVITSTKQMFGAATINPDSLNSSSQAYGHSAYGLGIKVSVNSSLFLIEFRIYHDFNNFALICELAIEKVTLDIDPVSRSSIEHCSRLSALIF